MSSARASLLEQLMTEVALNGLTDRSLRDVAEAAGTSHRMVLYHFGSRAGLVAAIVEQVESAQRDALLRLSATTTDPGELVLALWREVSSIELRPFVRLFFECVAATGGEGLTDPWLDAAAAVTDRIGGELEPDEIRLGVAVTRGLLIDVLATGDPEPATRSVERFVALWRTVRP